MNVKALMIFLVTLMLLGCLMAACSPTVPFPNSDILKQAITMQISQSQEIVSQHLGLYKSGGVALPVFTVEHIKIAQIKPLMIQNLPSFQVRGTYDLLTEFPPKPIQEKRNPFEVYLQSQKEGKTWRLARPQMGRKDDQIRWFTYLIQ